jgi:tetrahydromethanopterin S-methyltransferase subunit G
MEAEFQERRKSAGFVDQGLCNERHKNADERWTLVQNSLAKIERIAGKFNGLLYSVLGGLIVSMILLLLNLLVESQKLPKIKP